MRHKSTTIGSWLSRWMMSIKNSNLSFRQLNLMNEIWTVLESKGINTPSPIQNLAIPELLKGKSGIMSAQTGTGKTLAYTIPLIHRLKMQELNEGIRLTIPHRPRGIIFVPNRELAEQVEDAVKMFIYDVPLKFYAAFPGTNLKVEFDKIAQGFDWLITTPDRFERHRNANKLFLTNCWSMIIDEFDTLLDAGYEEFIENIVSQMIKKPENSNSGSDNNNNKNKTEVSQNKQIVFWSATVTKPIESFIGKFWIPGDKNFVTMIEKHTHMNLANLDHEFIKLTEKDKYKPLEFILKEFRTFKKTSQTSAIVFWNSIQSARSGPNLPQIC